MLKALLIEESDDVPSWCPDWRFIAPGSELILSFQHSLLRYRLGSKVISKRPPNKLSSQPPTDLENNSVSFDFACVECKLGFLISVTDVATAEKSPAFCGIEFQGGVLGHLEIFLNSLGFPLNRTLSTNVTAMLCFG